MSKYGGQCTWCLQAIGDYWCSVNFTAPVALCGCGQCLNAPAVPALWYGPERGWEPVKEKK